MAKTILSEGISLYRHGDYSGAITYFLSLPDDAELRDLCDCLAEGDTPF